MAREGGGQDKLGEQKTNSLGNKVRLRPIFAIFERMTISAARADKLGAYSAGLFQWTSLKPNEKRDFFLFPCRMQIFTNCLGCIERISGNRLAYICLN